MVSRSFPRAISSVLFCLVLERLNVSVLWEEQGKSICQRFKTCKSGLWTLKHTRENQANSFNYPLDLLCSFSLKVSDCWRKAVFWESFDITKSFGCFQMVSWEMSLGSRKGFSFPWSGSVQGRSFFFSLCLGMDAHQALARYTVMLGSRRGPGPCMLQESAAFLHSSIWVKM